MKRSIVPAPAHQVGDVVHGFRVESVTELPDIKALAYQAVHERTGAEVLHVHCHDEENMFSIGFRTPPRDSTGVAHILEHCVLAGSRRYPVTDAFNELGKRSLSTFLNAMTWPDRTVYPTCSAVRADYFNLAAVYTDLVLNPLIAERTFRQEGHHLTLADLDDAASDLRLTGVVYNEMKGAYSSPEQVVYRAMQQDLLPEGPYGVDSGGDPDRIPDLTYADFVAFHRRFYAPSNARIMLYGDVSLSDNLAFLEQVLAPFDRVSVDSAIPDEPLWSAPRSVELVYPVGSADSVDGKTFVTVGWRVNEATDPVATLLLDVLGSALVATAAGPLRRALIDSGLGKDIFPPGAYDADLRYAMFHVGLRGTEPDHAERVERLVLETLGRLVEEGIPSELLEAAFHQVEFAGREIVPPFPIMLLIRANPTWYFGADPKAGLSFGALVEEARARWAREPRLFEGLVRHWLLDNPHRLRLTVRPSTSLAAEEEARFEAAMAARKASMSEADVRRVIDEARALREAQERGDPPEALATLPMLAPGDVPRRVRTVPSHRADAAGVAVYEHEVFSNGVGYVGLAFDTRDLGDEWAPWLPLLARATTGMGAAGLTYEQMATRIAARTGGIHAAPAAGSHVRSGERFEQLLVDGKALARHAPELFAVLGDLLTAPDPSDAKRLRDLVLEGASRLTSQLVPAGHMFAYLRAAAALDVPAWRREQWNGATQVRFMNELAASGAVDEAMDRVRRLQELLFTRARLTVSLAGDAEVLAALREHVAPFVQALPAGEPPAPADAGAPGVGRASGVVIPAQVNYVGQVLRVPTIVHPAAPALALLSEVLSNDYLYQKLRVQGGAYGGFCSYAHDNGLLPMLSYRDPHLTETLDVYAGAVDFLRGDGLTEDTVAASRLGAIGSFDAVLSPAQQLGAARSWRFFGVTDEDRLHFRDGLLSMTAAEIREQALPLIEVALRDAPRAILASRERLEAAGAGLDGGLELFSPEPG